MFSKRIFTIGHSNRNLEELAHILRHYGVKVLVDVRHFPRSGRNPHFNKEVLEIKLSETDIEYEWLEDLGGFRKCGYEEYTKTEQFSNSLKMLAGTASKKNTAFMCAELDWRACHRRYIASELQKTGWKVVHILDRNRTENHGNIQYGLF